MLPKDKFLEALRAEGVTRTAADTVNKIKYEIHRESFEFQGIQKTIFPRQDSKQWRAEND